jgi:hypothetical protein
MPSRGVAQPGRAPGSGPGGRRFKSSLPDQSFSRLFSSLRNFRALSFNAIFRYIRYYWRRKPVPQTSITVAPEGVGSLLLIARVRVHVPQFLQCRMQVAAKNVGQDL